MIDLSDFKGSQEVSLEIRKHCVQDHHNPLIHGSYRFCTPLCNSAYHNISKVAFQKAEKHLESEAEITNAV